MFGSAMHSVKSFYRAGWYRIEFESTSTTMYWASSSTSRIVLLSANRDRISSRFSSVLLMEQTIGKGNSKIISLTFWESQFSISVS